MFYIPLNLWSAACQVKDYKALKYVLCVLSFLCHVTVGWVSQLYAVVPACYVLQYVLTVHPIVFPATLMLDDIAHVDVVDIAPYLPEFNLNLPFFFVLRECNFTPCFITVLLTAFWSLNIKLWGKSLWFSPLIFFLYKPLLSQICILFCPAAFLTQTVCLDDTTVKFEIWDTAGQERYHSLAPMYYRGAQAAIVVYDITNTVSYMGHNRTWSCVLFVFVFWLILVFQLGLMIA